jgi:hypothetical protein
MAAIGTFTPTHHITRLISSQLICSLWRVVEINSITNELAHGRCLVGRRRAHFCGLSFACQLARFVITIIDLEFDNVYEWH